MEVIISPVVFDRLEEAALKAYPEECGGLLLGRGRFIEAEECLPNRAPFPEQSFELDPCRVARTFWRAHQAEMEVLGVYHSHPGGTARPSSQDCRSVPPHCLSLILSVDSRFVGEVRGFVRESMNTSFKEIELVRSQIRALEARS